MNQILATHNNTNNNKRPPIDTHKIIVFFSIAIIDFGLIIICVAAYNLHKSSEEKKRLQEIGNPEISIEQIEDSVKILAKYDSGISSIIYTWNDEETYEINLNGITTIEKLIDMIDGEGENTLKVTVIGLNGRKNEISKVFNLESENSGTSEEGPIIQWIIKYNENKITAIATDETQLKYIRYQWDGNMPITIEPGEAQSRLEVDIDIERGQHRLTITAQDEDGNVSTKSGNFKGVKKPEISAIKYGDTVEITVSHDMGFKKVEFIVNDKIYIYDATYTGYSQLNTKLLYKVNLLEGENVIQVTAESLEQISADQNEGTTAVYKGRCEYNPNLETNE